MRGRKVAFGLVSALAVASMLFLWQGRNSGTTSVVVGQGEDNSTGFFTGGPCTDGPVLELLQAGIPTYDYEPAGSFDELANQSAAVVVGQVASMARTEVNGRSYIEVTVSDVFEISVDSGADTPRNDIEIIAYQAQWADRSAPDPLASPVAVDGLDFFGFLSPWSGVRGGWAPGPEGLYVSCNGPGLPVIASGAGPNDPADPGQWWAQKAAEQAAGQAMADAATAAEAANEAAEDQLDEHPIVETSGGFESVEAARQTLADAVVAEAEVRRGANRDNREADPVLLEELEAARFEAGRALWTASGISSYRLRYVESHPPSGFTSLVSLRIEDGHVVDTEFRQGSDEADQVFTVDEMFAIAASVDEVYDLTLDADTGHPVELRLDRDDAVRGDEFNLREIQVIPRQDLDDADPILQDWLPELVPLPEGLISLLRPSTDVTQGYLLHANDDLQVFLYLDGDEVCAVIDPFPTNADSTGAAGTCRFKTEFLANTVLLANSVPQGLTSYLLVVPSPDYLDQQWTAEAEGGTLDVTSWSVLFTEDEDAPLGQSLVRIQCECGDRTFRLPS
ncbi:MAG: hypothetical protein HOI41_21590 [Acidimicrobiaceae bacterium]|nr:hypothetical protein [Acidimicrobiaceae bacterium]